MPNPWGGRNTDRNYAPHMWVLGPEGNPANDEDYIFIGNVSGERIIDGRRYRMGADSIGQLFCEHVRLMEGSNSPQWGSEEHVPMKEIPLPVVYAALERATSQHDKGLLAALGVNVSLLEEIGINYDILFNGSIEEKLAEKQKIAQNNKLLQALQQQVDYLWDFLGLDRG
ncbi:hypothetical protein HYS84_00310 [Candidatus Saccharibacteria bacterium]|nr:hypothetical protein [Candidatus Saccharibacteria bacterium]